VLRDVDVVLDTVGGDTMERSWRVLRRGGTLVSVAAPPPPEPARDAGVRGIYFIVEPSRAQLVEIARLIDAGEVRPVLDVVLPLARAREAFERGLAGHLRGKIVLRVDDTEAIP
jgi:NADPH:quinone reductase-like Zn-dependent oxidoreductase